MKLIFAAAILSLSLTSSSSGQTGRFKALIIGNARYQHIDSLYPQPINDANRMASVLQGVGVNAADEMVLTDRDKKGLESAVRHFAQTLQPDDTAIFYFSGHGYSIEGSGFLAPIDIMLSKKMTKAQAREAGYSLFQLFDQLGRAGHRVVILDACRSDPHLEKQAFKDTLGNSFQLTPLRSVEPPVGTIVAFASSAGATSALRSSDDLSFYTHYLTLNLEGRPATFKQALDKTMADVAQASNNAQIPALYVEGSPPIVLSQGEKPADVTPLESIVIEKSGGTDPLDEGFKLHQPLEAKYDHDEALYNRETNGIDRWRIRTDSQNYYYRPLSAAQKDFALKRDWKLTCVCALEEGTGYANIDFGSGAARFDIEFLQEGSRFFVVLTKQISPDFEWSERIEFPGVADVAHPHTYELRFDHLAQSASLWIDGQQKYSGYRGHHQFLENRGLMFGAAIYGNSERGSFVVRVVQFQVN